MIRPVIFCDIDGVVRLMKAYGAPGIDPFPKLNNSAVDYYFDADCIAALRHLVEKTNAQIVIISTLRQLYEWEVLLAGFSASGFPVEYLHPDRMPDVARSTEQLVMQIARDRATEIIEWLEKHDEVKKWCVIDDELRHYEGPKRLIGRDRIFVPSTRFGLQPRTAECVHDFLLNRHKPIMLLS